MLVGPASTATQRAEFKKLILENPRNFIAQPVVELSQHPSLCDGQPDGGNGLLHRSIGPS